jgi:hypothetical protein
MHARRVRLTFLQCAGEVATRNVQVGYQYQQGQKQKTLVDFEPTTKVMLDVYPTPTNPNGSVSSVYVHIKSNAIKSTDWGYDACIILDTIFSAKTTPIT